MIDKIFDSIYQNTYFTFSLFLALFVSFCLQIDKLKVSLLPNVDPLGFRIITQVQNLGAEEVDSLITLPLIQALEKTKDQKEILGRSTFGYSEIELYLNHSKFPEEAYENIQQILFETRDSLPNQTNRSTVLRIQKSILPFYEIALPVSNKKNFDFLSREIQEFNEELQKLDGISQIQVFGLETDPIVISADSLKMDQFPIHTKIIEDSLHRYQQKESLGILETKIESYLLQSESRYQNLEDIQKISTDVSTIKKPLELGRVISVHGPHESKRRWSRWNQKNSVLIRIFRLPEANPLLLATQVRKKLNQFEILENAVILTDESKYLKDQIVWMILFSVFAFFGSFFISYYYYRSVKYSVYLIFGLIFGILISFHFLILFSIPFHILTFCAFGIGIGIMYDSINVVIYSIHNENTEQNLKKEIVKNGLRTVFLSIFSAMSTTVIAFLPIILFEDKVLFLFKDFAKIISILIACGFISSLLLTPALFLEFGFVSLPNLKKEKSSYILERFCLHSCVNIGKFFRSNAIFVGIPILLLVLVSIRFEIFPQIEKKGLWIEIDSAFTTSNNDLLPLILNLEEDLRRKSPKVEILVVPKEHSGPWRKSILVYINHPLELSIVPEITKDLKSKGFKIRFGTINNYLEDILPVEKSDGISFISLDSQVLYNNINHIKQELNKNNIGFFPNKDITKTKAKIQNTNFISRMDLGFGADDFLEVSRLIHLPKWIGRTKDNSKTDIYLGINYGMVRSDLVPIHMKSNTGKSISTLGLWESKNEFVFDELHRKGRYFFAEFRPLVHSEGFQDFFENKISTYENSDLKMLIDFHPSSFNNLFLLLTLLLGISFFFIFLLLSSLNRSYYIAFYLLIPSFVLTIFVFIFSSICLPSFHIGTYLGLLLLIGVSVDSTTLYWEKISKLSMYPALPLDEIEILAFRWYLGPVCINHLTSIIGIIPVYIYGFQGMEIPFSIVSILVPGFIFSFILQCTLTPSLFRNLFLRKDQIRV